MKRFLLLFLPIAMFAAVCALSGASLGDVFSTELTKSEYHASDLGFVFESEKLDGFVEYKKENQIVGECVWLSGGKERLEHIASKLGLVVTNKYYVESKLLVEGFSARLKFVGNGQSNVQIAVENGKIVIGSPIIFGSY